MNENKIIIKAIVLPQQKYIIDKPAWFSYVLKKNNLEIKEFPFVANDLEGFELFRIHKDFIDGYVDENGNKISVAEYKDKLKAIYPDDNKELTKIIELQLEIEASKHKSIVIEKIEKLDIEFSLAHVPCLENKYIQPLFHLEKQSFEDAFYKINICHYCPNAKEMIKKVCKDLKIQFTEEDSVFRSAREGYSLSHTPLKFDKLNDAYIKYERESLNGMRFVTVEDATSRYENDMNMIKIGIQLHLAKHSKDPLSKVEKGEILTYLIDLGLKLEEVEASRKTQQMKLIIRNSIAKKVSELSEGE